MTGSPSTRTRAKDGDDGSSGGGGGLDNLFALAHIAAMSEEERAASRSPPQATAAEPPRAAEGSTTATTANVKKTSSGPAASRRPAKKRAVPSDFEPAADDVAPNNEVLRPRAAPSVATAAPTTPSAPTNTTSKRPKQSRRSSKSRASSGTFKMKANQPSFPVILMAILSAPQNKEFITFLSDGASFIVVHPGALARNVLPMHFEENVPSFDQFLYLLAIWGFETIKDPRYPQVSVYRHPDFRNGDWEACLQMKLPDPTEVAKKKKESTPPTKNGRAPENVEAPAAAAEEASPSSVARSVTPPLEAKVSGQSVSDAALLERVSARGVSAQTNNSRQPYSNLGPKFTDAKDGLAYQRLLQQERGMQDHPAFLGARSANVMNGYPTMKDAAAMRMNHRRATLDMPPSMMSSSLSGSAMHNMGHRRATLDMPPPSASALMGGANGMPPTMAPRRMGGRLSLPFANAGFHPGSQPQRPQRQVVQRPRQVPPRATMNSSMAASHPSSTPSDAEVRSATEDIVSKALEALRPKLANSRRHTIDHPPTGSTARLDAMTDLFLERSLMRLRKGPGVNDMSGLMGGNAPMSQGLQHGAMPRSSSMQGTMRQPQSFMGNESRDRPVRRHSIVEVDAKAASIAAAAAAVHNRGNGGHPYRRVTMMGMPPNAGPTGFGGGRAA